ncbi:Xaa-Pro peptidase family protein [Bradyrhizobium sp. B124]|uniref:M24 family metallopeptidase n=1 Tax=Bradyrhizobium sp. B124 TaxID=3140245 RepID=UPI0031833069
MEKASRMKNVFKDDRKRAYLNPEGADRALVSPISDDVLDRARRYRIARTRQHMQEDNLGAVLLYDPVNLRYVFDSSNMAIWCMHNPTRYGLVIAGGPAILFDREKHLFKGLPGIDEVRLNQSWTYFVSAEHQAEHVEAWADQIVSLLSDHKSNMRVGVDHLDPRGTWALQKRGVTISDAQRTIERARSIKSSDELTLMRWTIRVCEAGMARMYEESIPGKTEREIWAQLHFENARSGGEWLETKLLSSGAKTNPWWTECSDRVVSEGEMIAFDTDMIGPYGYIADLSRSWTCGHTRMNPTQRRIYCAAVEQIEHNMALIRPGVEFREFNEKSWHVPERYLPYRYSVALHGSGMADEWPLVPLHADWGIGREGMFEENMVVNVESLIAEEGSESVKLETQVVVTKHGAERLDSFPWEII